MFQLHTDFQGVENYIKKQPRICLSNVPNDKKIQIDGFITSLLSLYTTENYTMYYDGTILGKWKRRTITDIYKLVLHYVGDVSLQETADCLLKLVGDGVLFSFICPDIDKRIWKRLGSLDNDLRTAMYSCPTMNIYLTIEIFQISPK